MYVKYKLINRYDNLVCVFVILRCRYVYYRVSNGNDGYGWNGNNIVVLIMCIVFVFWVNEMIKKDV